MVASWSRSQPMTHPTGWENRFTGGDRPGESACLSSQATEQEPPGEVKTIPDVLDELYERVWNIAYPIGIIYSESSEVAIAIASKTLSTVENLEDIPEDSTVFLLLVSHEAEKIAFDLTGRTSDNLIT